MKLFARYKRRFLNGINIGYTLSNIFTLFEGYLYLLVGTESCTKSVEKIELGDIPVYVISLRFREDRRSQLKNTIGKLLNYEIIDAVHGVEIKTSRISGHILTASAKKYLTKGSIGCIFSHLKSWQIAVKNGNKCSLILEDDVIVTQNFDNINAALKSAPEDFDIIYLGSSNTLIPRKKKLVNSHFFVPVFPRKGMFSYVIKTASISRIINSIMPIKICAGGIDTLIGKLILDGKIKAYHLQENLIAVDKRYASNIVNPSMPNKKIHFKENSDVIYTR